MTGVRSFLREDSMPHVLCTGCAHGIVLRAFLEAVVARGLDQDKLAVVAGIGCSSRLAGHIDVCTLHTTHGRAPTFAAGLKAARPDLTVAVITGDGDGLAIGGNHLIHAARRNLDLTVILFNNEIYGMTGGQIAPTMGIGDLASTAPYGNPEPPFDPCKLLIGAGATFVARAIAAQPPTLTGIFDQALAHRGFSFIEVVSDCPTYFGRINDAGDDWQMLTAMNGHEPGVSAPLAAKRFVDHIPATPERKSRPMGVLHRDEDRPEYGERYRSMTHVGTGAAPSSNGATKVRPARTVATHGGSDDAQPKGPRRDIRLAGMGGQGMVKAGAVLAESVLMSGRHATHSQVYGPEARGGASRSDVVISHGEIGFPLTERLDVLVALSPQACTRFLSDLRDGGLLVVDDSLAGDVPAGSFETRSFPIVATALHITGGLIGTGVVALGVLAELSEAVDVATLEEAVAARFGSKHRDTSLRAFAAGRQLVSADGPTG